MEQTTRETMHTLVNIIKDPGGRTERSLASPCMAIRQALGPDPVFAVDEDGKQIEIFAPDSALLQTVRMALEDTNQRRISAASKNLGFDYIP